ncbi:GNAT family N-acetyltransferase [Microbacterium sp. NPDC091313]
MTTSYVHDLPLDERSARDIAARGLRYRRVANDGPEFDAFLGAVARGFLDPEPTDEQIADSRDALSIRRLTAVFDDEGVHPDRPVATIDSWRAELTTSPGTVVPMWSISGVSVAPTHRRRGIATALIGGELRTAADAGYALAGLTVSEATIYGRWGFSPAVFTADWRVDTRRARWIGPSPEGRLDFVETGEIAGRLERLHERFRLAHPGEVSGWPALWRRTAGLRPGADENRKVRAVVHRRDGEDRGILVYSLAAAGRDFGGHELQVRTLLALDADATAALWRFALEHDLVDAVTATLQSVEGPLRWMISDQRALKVDVTDHHWLRILDVPRALSARTYAAPADLVLRVTDPLGFAEGVYRFGVAPDGTAAIERADEDAPVDAALDVGALASALLGGVRWSALAAAGRVTGAPETVAILDGAFVPAVAPSLSIWY